MILDDFKQHALVIQINYASAFELWDNAGSLARELSAIWGPLSVNEANPQTQILQGEDVALSIGFDQSVLTMLRANANPARSSERIASTYEAWVEKLRLLTLQRVSARSTFHKEFDSLDGANAFVLNLGLARWPKSQVFNQDKHSGLNTLDVAFRFQDETAFSVVRVKAEKVTFQAKLDKEFVDEPINVERCRVIVDFDRGTLGETSAGKLRISEWLKGYHHLMRRDIPKVLEMEE